MKIGYLCVLLLLAAAQAVNAEDFDRELKRGQIVKLLTDRSYQAAKIELATLIAGPTANKDFINRIGCFRAAIVEGIASNQLDAAGATMLLNEVDSAIKLNVKQFPFQAIDEFAKIVMIPNRSFPFYENLHDKNQAIVFSERMTAIFINGIKALRAAWNPNDILALDKFPLPVVKSGNQDLTGMVDPATIVDPKEKEAYLAALAQRKAEVERHKKNAIIENNITITLGQYERYIRRFHSMRSLAKNDLVNMIKAASFPQEKEKELINELVR
jgi:hypothetical protein